MECENCGALNGEWVGSAGEEISVCPPCQEAIKNNIWDEETRNEALRS